MEDVTQSAEQLRASLVNLAQEKIEAGIIHEPRAFFDTIDLNQDGLETFGHAEVFKNGEQFPIRLTHMTAAVGLLDQEGEDADERQIQRLALRMVFHQQAYMNQELVVPVQQWANKNVAAAEPISAATSSWRFEFPFVLSTLDTLSVVVQAVRDDLNAQTAVTVTVAFTGIGMLSGRPHFFNGEVALSDAQRTTITTTAFRSDGDEPVIVKDMTVNLSAGADAEEPTGDIRGVRLNIRQNGNGTNAFWFQGPATLPGGELMPATLLGQQTGRAVVHKFPGNGLIWEPGEGIDVITRALRPSALNQILNIALLGYVIIT